MYLLQQKKQNNELAAVLCYGIFSRNGHMICSYFHKHIATKLLSLVEPPIVNLTALIAPASIILEKSLE